MRYVVGITGDEQVPGHLRFIHRNSVIHENMRRNIATKTLLDINAPAQWDVLMVRQHPNRIEALRRLPTIGVPKR